MINKMKCPNCKYKGVFKKKPNEECATIGIGRTYICPFCKNEIFCDDPEENETVWMKLVKIILSFI